MGNACVAKKKLINFESETTKIIASTTFPSDEKNPISLIFASRFSDFFDTTAMSPMSTNRMYHYIPRIGHNLFVCNGRTYQEVTTVLNYELQRRKSTVHLIYKDHETVKIDIDPYDDFVCLMWATRIYGPDGMELRDTPFLLRMNDPVLEIYICGHFSYWKRDEIELYFDTKPWHPMRLQELSKQDLVL